MADETKDAAPSRDELIRLKVRAGLTREQAIDVVDRQLAYDKDQAKKAKAK